MRRFDFLWTLVFFIHVFKDTFFNPFPEILGFLTLIFFGIFTPLASNVWGFFLLSLRKGSLWASHDKDQKWLCYGRSIVQGLRTCVISMLTIGIVLVYRRLIRPWLSGSCRFHPTCSSYAIQALQQHGLLSGLLLILWRMVRCHPWGPCGYDPVPSSLFSSS